jgi:hypothetical protein
MIFHILLKSKVKFHIIINDIIVKARKNKIIIRKEFRLGDFEPKRPVLYTCIAGEFSYSVQV